MKTLLQRIGQILKSRRIRKIWYSTISSIAVLVIFAATYALVLPAITLESNAMACGIEAHQHTDDCYEEKLVCGQEESEGHHHDDDCYSVFKRLVCDIDEHQHNDSCYNQDGNLVCEEKEHDHSDDCWQEVRELTCDIEESEGHHHDSSCYEKVLVCEKEAHIHSERCYERAGEETYNGGTTEKADEAKTDAPEKDEDDVQEKEPEQEYKSGTLTSDGDGYTVTMDYTADAKIPENARLYVREITAETDRDSYEEYLAKAEQHVAESGEEKVNVDKEATRFFDIEILVEDGDGNTSKIEPAAPVNVRIHMDDAPAAFDGGNQPDPTVLHFAEEGVETIESTAGEAVKDGSDSNANNTDKKAAEKSGSTAESGDSTEIRFEAESFSVYGVVYTVDFHCEINGKMYEFSIPGGGFVSLEHVVEVLGIASADENGKAYEEAIKLSEVEVSEAAKRFVENVESMVFSDPELVWVGKIEEAATVGGIKESRGLEVEYSAELTEEQIAEINAQTVEAGDWALIGKHPFLSEETLTVTMKNGEAFTILVTDAQIKKTVIDAKGGTWEITVTYGEEAQIPEDVDLNVREILEGTEEYDGYLTDSAKELSVDNCEISFARFFDIEIVKDGEKIEPAAPVMVNIAYKDAVEISEEEALCVVHFADPGTEIISDFSISEDKTEIVYMQSGFSVTGTIISSLPNSNTGHQYMVLVNYPNDSNNYYIVNNDGTLTEVNYNSAAGTVDAAVPMLWTVDGSNTNRHIYFHTEATGFTAQQTASDYYRRYIDPSAENAITEENSSNITIRNGRVTNRTNILNQTALGYNNGDVYRAPINGSNHLGVELDEKGVPVRLIGRQNAENRAEIVFAEAGSVPAVGASTHTVDHIDISIKGTSNITVPLAFGTYYYKDGNGQWAEYTVTSNISLDLSKDDVNITPEDMKGATIKAYDKNGNELNNAFVITGYSSNDEIGNSTVQVRIEGRFKVANLYEDAPANNPNSREWKNLRNNNKIKYTVSAAKPLTYDLIETANGYGQLYEKLADGTYRPLSVTVDVNMSASFDYWDERNECPAVHDEIIGIPVTGIWENGGIPAATYPYSGNSNSSYLSGMDFKLGGDAEDSDSKIVAIEITKMIVDQNGGLIPLKTSVVQSFDVYGSSTDSSNNVIGVNVPSYTADYPNENYNSYTELHSKDIRVGTSGMGLVYDYDITPGMYYIKEDAKQIPQTIVTSDDEVWKYKETRIETEYVWRNDMYSGNHVSAVYTDTEHDSYRSIPEVAGNYMGLLNPAATEQPSSAYNSTTWNNDGKTGTYRNGFLEFFVYNVYEPVYSDISITVKKVAEDDVNNPEASTLPGAAFRLEKYTAAACTASDKDPSWTEVTINDNDNTTAGVFSFSGLSEGYYKLVEVNCPAGYVKSAYDPVFHVKPDNDGLIVVLVDPDGNDMEETITDLLKVENAADSHTLIVGNPPGAALPNTGGPGTRLVTTLGSILILGAGVLLWRRRRLI